MMRKLVLLSLLIIAMAANAQELALANVKEGFGYITKSGDWHIKPQFKVAKDFSGNLAAATMGKKWGFINRKGDWQIEPNFDRVKHFDSGIAVVLKDKEWFYINEKGERIFADLDTDKIYDFNDGYALIRKGEAIGFINKEGKTVVAPKFTKMMNFVNGYAKVQENGKWGLIDKQGNYFVKPDYDGVSNYYGDAIVAKKGETHGLIIDGAFKVVEGAQKIWDFNAHSDLTYAKKGDLIGFINKRGEWVIAPAFNKAKAFRNGLAPVNKSKKWGYIDETGKEVISFQYRDAEVFSDDGLAPVKSAKLWGFIDKTGKLVIEEKYVITAGNMMMMFKKNVEKGFIDGLARVKYKKSWGYINTKGELLKDTWFINLELFK